MCKFYMTSAPRFVPVAYSCNKLVLCNISYHAAYLKRLTQFVREAFPDTRTNLVRRFGYDTLNVPPNLQDKRYLAPQPAP